MQNSTYNAGSRALAAMLENSGNKFFTVNFVKKDGSVRQMTARTGVTKYLKGGKKTVNEDQYLTVYEPSSGSYKNINRDTILSVRALGVEAVVV